MTAATIGLNPTASGAATDGTSDGRPWLAPGLTVDQRVDRLLAAMTLDEKIAELHADHCPPYEACIPANKRLGIPELVLQDGPAGVADGFEGVTALPATIAASASWDRALIKRYGQVIGSEQRGKGVDVALAPTINIARAPQWGRTFESTGEDPYLNGQMGAADIQGIQSQGIVADVKHFAVYNQETARMTVDAEVDPRAVHEIYLPAFQAAFDAGVGSVMASYNALNGVLNSQNPYLLTDVLRDEMGFEGFVRSDGRGTYSTVPAAQSGLNIQVRGTDYFGSPLKAAVVDGQVSMARLNSMVRPILRTMFLFHLFDQEWGNGTRTGNVITPENTQTALDAAEQGTVLLKNDNAVLPLSTDQVTSVAVLGPAASDAGLARGDGSSYVQRPFVVTPAQGIQAAVPNARVTSVAGLPQPGTLPSIPASDLSPAYRPGNKYSGTLTPTVSGRYTLVVRDPKGQTTTVSVDGTDILRVNGSRGDIYGGSVDLQAGHQYHLEIDGPSDKLQWADPSTREAAIDQAVAAARSADVAVVVAGYEESEGLDRVGFGLGGGQDDLVEAVAAANPRTIVVLNTGGPVLMPWLDHVPAVLEAWYPGEHNGTALASVLFGRVNPSAKLPVTFPATADQVPASTPAQFPGVNGVSTYSEGLRVGYRWYDANGRKPLFPFGYGLSYTSFAFSDLTVSPSSTTSLGTVRVAATVTNTGTRTGAEVAQLYLGHPAGDGEPPRQLKGFQKVTLDPGESTRVRFTLTPDELSIWDTAANTWVVDKGTYRIMVGDSSANLPLTGSVDITASTGSRAVTIDAPDTMRTGQPTTVTATFSPGGDLALQGVGLSLAAPTGWQVKPLGPAEVGTLRPDQGLTARWQVTAPADAEDDIWQLAATATYSAGADAPASKTARRQITALPLVTTTTQPASVTIAEGGGTSVTLRNTNTSGYPVTLTWNARPADGSGVTVSPATGTATLEPGETATQELSVGASTPGSTTVPIEVRATAMSTTRDTPGAYLDVTVPYPSLAAAFDNVGITSASDPTAGNFSGTGVTYSADALAQVGLTPGASVTAFGTTFTWPDVPAGQADNVVAGGQMIALSGTGSRLAFLGASAFGDITGTGTITYTDGTTQPFTITVPDFYGAPGQGEQAVAIAPYRNTPSGISNLTATVYYDSVALDPGRTVAYVTLPDISAEVVNGQPSMHIFAMAIGNG